jgi:hypothetical protein
MPAGAMLSVTTRTGMHPLPCAVMLGLTELFLLAFLAFGWHPDACHRVPTPLLNPKQVGRGSDYSHSAAQANRCERQGTRASPAVYGDLSRRERDALESPSSFCGRMRRDTRIQIASVVATPLGQTKSPCMDCSRGDATKQRARRRHHRRHAKVRTKVTTKSDAWLNSRTSDT